MKKRLRFEMYGSVEVPGDSPVGALYNDRGRKVGEIVSQVEASNLPESGAFPQKIGTLCTACVGSISRLSFECALRALIKHGSMIEAIKLPRQ